MAKDKMKYNLEIEYSIDGCIVPLTIETTLPIIIDTKIKHNEKTKTRLCAVSYVEDDVGNSFLISDIKNKEVRDDLTEILEFHHKILDSNLSKIIKKLFKAKQVCNGKNITGFIELPVSLKTEVKIGKYCVRQKK